MSKHDKSSNTNRFRVGDQVICYRRGRQWWVEFYAAGRQQRVSLKTKSKKEAQRRAAQIEVNLVAGTFKPAPPATSVSELINLYTNHLKTEDRTASTLKRYDPELERWRAFIAREGITQINGVSRALVEKYRAERKGEVSAGTLYHETILIKQLLNFAHDRGLVAANPLKKLKLKRPKPAPQPSFTLDQVARIIAAGGCYADIYEVLAFTGLRIGELRWLTWEDVEFDADGEGGFIWVRAKPDEWRPKHGDDRKVPLHSRVARLLARRARSNRFVFTSRSGRQVSDRHVLAKLKTILKRLGIAEGKVHTFRHFFVTSCANHGVEPFKLMRWVGHSDISIVLRYYSLGDDESRRAIEGLPFDDVKTDRKTDAKQAQIKHNNRRRKSA